MTWGAVRLVLGWLATALLLVAARPVLAGQFPGGSVCHASAGAGEDYAALARESGRWNCEQRDWSIATERAFLRIDLRESAGPAPRLLVTRLTRFEAMRVTVIGRDGRTASRDVTQADMTPATSDWMMRTPLPRIEGAVDAVVIRIDKARHVGLLSDMRLTGEHVDTPDSLRHELVIAGLCGVLWLPLLFNFAFFRVMREKFLLWHAFATGMMFTHTLITSGLINRFVSLSLDQLSFFSALSIGGGITAASFFSADLIEAGKLDPLHRRLLRCVGLWIVPWTLFYLFADGPLRAVSAPAYMVSFLPLIALYVWVMVVAKRRGSRAVNFQIAAWLPIIFTALIRIVTLLGATDAPKEALLEQHVALGLEVIITWLGVVDRFMAIRRERDVAWRQSRQFERLAERDPLTGLLNRRGIEERFEELYAQGFDAMAVIDLDHFKQVNDRHGHSRGDQVLCAAAGALAPDEDTLAVRLGGEEFLLLLRGKDISARAERRRQAITVRVASEVPGLDRVVTASMGLVQHPSGGRLSADFAALYAHCDRLLYEAKDAGRNRTMSEKLQSFGGARKRSEAAA